jgi:hypothetical protein
VTVPPLPATVLLVTGTVLMVAAVYNERRMHRHRQPGVTYAQATFRRDGAWRRTDIFTAEGLRHQRLASAFGVPAALLWVIGLIVWAMTGV